MNGQLKWPRHRGRERNRQSMRLTAARRRRRLRRRGINADSARAS